MFKIIIKELRESHKLTQEDIAKYLHIQRTTYTRYEIGTNSMNIDTICKLADLYGVSTDFLLGRNEHSLAHIDLELMQLYNDSPPIFRDIALTVLKKGQAHNQAASVASKKVFIPVINSDVIGLPIEIITSSNSEQTDIVQNEIINTGDFAIIAPDDSMADANINMGDYVIIRPQQSINVGEIALVSVENHSLLRTVIEQEGRITLVPANSGYQTQYYKNSNELYIVGKMIKAIKKQK